MKVFTDTESPPEDPNTTASREELALAYRAITQMSPTTHLGADPAEWVLVYRAAALLRKETDRALAHLRTTVTQAYVLSLLEQAAQPLPVTWVARALLQESPSITRLVDRMTARGLVKRLPDPKDGRRSLVAATDKGKDLLEQVRKPATDTNGAAFGVLSGRERATLKRLLGKFTDAALDRLEIT